MRDFIMFFEGKEGTSPLVRLLDNFDRVSIVRKVGSGGWEPFDVHECGPMRRKDLRRCFELMFSPGPTDMERLNQIYTRTASEPLEEIPPGTAIGFKMRFRPSIHRQVLQSPRRWKRVVRKVLHRYDRRAYRAFMIDSLKRNKVVVLFVVRQDLLRWGLSRYHGDGTGKQGHLQFKLASGEIRREDIGTIDVDCDRLEKVLNRCEQLHRWRQARLEDFRRAGLDAHAVSYEDFMQDKHEYFRRLFQLLEIEVSENDIDKALDQGAVFKKVHSDEISDFVENHEEVLARFGDRFIGWS